MAASESNNASARTSHFFAIYNQMPLQVQGPLRSVVCLLQAKCAVIYLACKVWHFVIYVMLQVAYHALLTRFTGRVRSAGKISLRYVWVVLCRCCCTPSIAVSFDFEPRVRLCQMGAEKDCPGTDERSAFGKTMKRDRFAE